MLLGAPRLVVCFRWPQPAVPAARYLGAAERVVNELSRFPAVQIAWSGDRFSYCMDGVDSPASSRGPASSNGHVGSGALSTLQTSSAVMQWLAECPLLRSYAVGVAFRPLKQKDNVGVWGPGLHFAEALAQLAATGEVVLDASLESVADITRWGRCFPLNVKHGTDPFRAIRWVPLGQTPPPPVLARKPRSVAPEPSMPPSSLQPTPRPSSNLRARAPRKPILLETSDLEELDTEAGAGVSQPVEAQELEAALRLDLPEVGSDLHPNSFAEQLRARLVRGNAALSRSPRGLMLRNGILESLAEAIEGRPAGILGLKRCSQELRTETEIGEFLGQFLEVRSQLALSVAQASSGEPEESLLTALHCLARAREFGDAEGQDTCRRWLSNLARRDGEFGAAAAWEVTN